MCITHADWDLETSEELKYKFDLSFKFLKTLTAVKVSRCHFYDIKPHDYVVSMTWMGFRMLPRRLMGVVSI